MNCHPQLSAGVHSCQQSNAYICRYVCTVIPWLKIAFSQQISHSKIAISWECSADSMRPKCCPSPVLNKWRAILLVARVWKLWLMYPKSFQQFKIHKMKTHKNLVLYSDDLSQGFDLVRVLVCVCVCVCVLGCTLFTQVGVQSRDVHPEAVKPTKTKTFTTFW